ncbi:MAG: NADH-quinone oxidoreductase subunit M [Euryarchaeota archaeon]|nr:NADH-quinone oxidoreductase subunit M [Euryarchaeota archaeon]
MLAYLVLLPLLGALGSYLGERYGLARARSVALGTSLLTALLSVLVLQRYLGGAEMFPEQSQVWISDFGIGFILGVDAMSLSLVLLTALLYVVAVLASWNISTNPGRYFGLLMTMEAGLMGVFLALDLFLFYVFWEIVLIPAFFLINGWGGERRSYAAMKVLIYTHLGSLFMFIGIIMLYLKAGSFSFFAISDMLSAADAGFKSLVFLLLFVGFAFKIPLVPFHTWLPDAYTEAPTPVTILLAGLLSKMGAYGLLRLGVTLLPETFQSYAYAIALLALVSVFYAAFTALAQRDIKRLVAFSSVSHMGFLVLGIASFDFVGISGAIFQMVSHGLIVALLFFLTGMLVEKVGSREIPRLGGLITRAPFLGWVLVFASLASLGLPGLSGFVAELSILLGLFSTYPFLAYLAVLSLPLTAGYYLWMLQRSTFGATSELVEGARGDVRWHEAVPVLLLVVLITLLGLYPAPLMEMIGSTSREIVALIGGI